MKREILKDHEAKTLFNECKNYPELIGGLELYEARKLLAIAKRGFGKYQSRIAKEMKTPYWMDDDNYPDEYLPDRCFQYHLEHTDHGEPMKYYRMKERLKTRISQIKNEEKKNSENVSSNEGKELWDQLSNDQRQKIKNALVGKDSGGRRKYSIDEYRTYLAVHLIFPNSVTRKAKKEKAAKYLNGEKANRMKGTPDSRLSDWEDWLK